MKKPLIRLPDLSDTIIPFKLLNLMYKSIKGAYFVEIQAMFSLNLKKSRTSSQKSILEFNAISNKKMAI